MEASRYLRRLRRGIAAPPTKESAPAVYISCPCQALAGGVHGENHCNESRRELELLGKKEVATKRKVHRKKHQNKRVC